MRARLCAAALAVLALVAAPAHAQIDALRSWFGLGADEREAWKGDFDGMVERRQIRVLVVPSRTFYFVDRGTQRGLDYDGGKALEDDVNKKLGRRLLRVEVVFIPVTHSEIIPALIKGRGDVAAANLTVTPERAAWVDFTTPLLTGVSEIAVSGPGAPPVTKLEDLAGQELFVRLSSSYFQSLWRLNRELAGKGLAPVRVKAAPEALEDEDILEMVNAGLLPLAVVDSHKAEFWAQVYPKLVLHPDVAVRSGSEIAWAFRKDSPKLAAMLDDFVRRHGKGTAFGNQKFREYLKSTKQVKNAASEKEQAKFAALIEFFQKYGSEYEFDHLMLAAQGYQESRLDQNVRSKVGAVGVMQVMPATGKELGVGDIRQTEPNIHAGTKYMRTLVDRYFPDAQMDEVNRCLFAFAGYNAGPNRIARLRKEAAKRGLDPNVWFNQVELVVAEKVGQETVRYVANIYKYYIAYKLIDERQRERERAKQSVRAG
jgi:membrane-bound lytic murein transglycosylase MltF